MRGINSVTISGNVGARIVFSEDGGCHFDIACEGKGGDTTWVGVSIYVTGLVGLCRTRLQRGGYVIVRGYLSNRKGGRMGVKGEEIIFWSDSRQPSERAATDVET